MLNVDATSAQPSVVALHSPHPMPPAPETSLARRLASNGDINYWDAEIEGDADRDPQAREVKILFERGQNRLKVHTLRLPSILFHGSNRHLLIRYLTASAYNISVCEGAEHIVFFMDDKAEEARVTAAVAEQLLQGYEYFDAYANFGRRIQVSDSSDFEFNIRKELRPGLPLSLESEAGQAFLGVDVGGTYIKTAIMHDGRAVHYLSEDVERSEGGEYLRHQIVDQIRRAQRWVRRHLDADIQSLGLTFPAPIRNNPDGSFEIVRMTNFERYWSEARDGATDFSADYEALNGIVDGIKSLGITDVSVLNDANAFGYGEIMSRIIQGMKPGEMGTKIVLPIGTGPGYVKIADGVIEDIPQQGGHVVIDLRDDASADPGCGVRGCYGGYVPGSAVALRAKKLGIDISGRDDFVPTDLSGALALLADIARRVAATAVKLHKITGADEVILAGGITGGYTGRTLARAANDVIEREYPRYAGNVSVVLSNSDLEYGGAIGAARYALAASRSSRNGSHPNWRMAHRLPETRVGKGNIAPFFDQMKSSGERAFILTTRGLADFILSQNGYAWFITSNLEDRIVYIDDFASVDDLIARFRDETYGVIVPIGGGKVTDWGKYVGSRLGKRVVAIPSVLSGNGMFTEKAIFYPGTGTGRRRLSETSGPPAITIIDLEFIRSVLGFNPPNGISSERANRAGTGDILSIYPAHRDWELAIKAGRERDDPVIMGASEGIFRTVEAQAPEIAANSDLGMIVLVEAMAEASLLNMRFGTSRPKDGSEHLLADEIDRLLPSGTPALHGEQVTIAALLMCYLYSTNYDERAFTRIRDFARAAGLPTNPDGIGMPKDVVVRALQEVGVRPDKYTYFDRFGADMTAERAEQVYEIVFGSKTGEIEEFRFEVSRAVNNSVKAMFAHVQDSVLPNLDQERIDELVDLLLETKRLDGRVIINAAGRVGEVAVFFQQKLRALGFVVDDFREITPEFLINREDLVLTFSGSGTTSSVVDNLRNVDILHRQGKLTRPIFSISANPRADTWRIGEGYHRVMWIPGRSKDDTMPTATEGDMYLPLSSTFEYSTLLFLEGLLEVLTSGADGVDAGARMAIVRDTVGLTPAKIKGEFTKRLQENEHLTSQFIELLLGAMERVNGGVTINKKKRVYLFGLGQNNYVIRLFARRIQNIGFEVYVPGPRDIISSASEGDIAIFVSNSGARETMLRKMRTARDMGCKTVVITADAKSDLARHADIAIPISSMTTRAHTVDIMDSSEESRAARSLKRMFEVAAMFYLEGASVALMQQLGIGSKDLQHVPKEWE